MVTDQDPMLTEQIRQSLEKPTPEEAPSHFPTLLEILGKLASEATEDARRLSRAGDSGRARDAHAAAAYLHRRAAQLMMENRGDGR